MSQHSIRAESDAVEISRRIAALHLGRWAQARPLMLVRLVSRPAASQLAVPSGDVLGTTLAFDIGLSVSGAAVAPTASLVDRWLSEPDVDLNRIRRQGLRNTERALSAGATVHHRTISHRRTGFRLTVLSGGLFTTGVIAVSEQVLPRIGVAPTTGPRWLSALSATVVIVVDQDVEHPATLHPPATPHPVERVRALCTEMAAITEQSLPANLFQR